MTWGQHLATIHDALGSVFGENHTTGVYSAPSGLVKQCRVVIDETMDAYPPGLESQVLERAVLITLYGFELAQTEPEATVTVPGRQFTLKERLAADYDPQHEHRWLAQEND